MLFFASLCEIQPGPDLSPSGEKPRSLASTRLTRFAPPGWPGCSGWHRHVAYRGSQKTSILSWNIFVRSLFDYVDCQFLDSKTTFRVKPTGVRGRKPRQSQAGDSWFCNAQILAMDQSYSSPGTILD